MLDWMRPSVKQPTRPRLSSQDPNNGDTPLHRAVKMALGNVLGEEPLRECLSDASTTCEQGFEVSELRCAQRLLNKDGLMPIHLAAARGSVSVCEALLNAGAPINARSMRREPLVSASATTFCCPPEWGKRAHNGHGELEKVPMADKTALHFAVGLLCDQQENTGEAVEESDMELVRLLLRLGADVNAPDFHGRTPFHLALIGGVHEVVAMLADGGADLTKSCRSFGQNNTAIHLATMLRDVRMVALLAARGASVDAIGRDGWTPLCLAARQNSPQVAKALLDAKADVFAPSHNGKTALDIATLNSKRTKTPSAVLLLLQHEVAVRVLEIAFKGLDALKHSKASAAAVEVE